MGCYEIRLWVIMKKEKIRLRNSENGFTGTTIKPLDPEEFRRQGHMVIDFLAIYYKYVKKYLVRSQVQPGYLRERLPEFALHDPKPIEEILKDVQKDIVPVITH
ncbi:Tyrosine decarboxylase 1 [Forsythia ovata]|uniref:Tyrosine decarboxylase 1 n=1 Tax=Forsythia ovata TaxID=205694 RepID=A0ABD1X1R3_9LAMI